MKTNTFSIKNLNDLMRGEDCSLRWMNGTNEQLKKESSNERFEKSRILDKITRFNH